MYKIRDAFQSDCDCKKSGFAIELFCGFVCILYKRDYRIKDCLLDSTYRNIFLYEFQRFQGGD